MAEELLKESKWFLCSRMVPRCRGSDQTRRGLSLRKYPINK